MANCHVVFFPFTAYGHMIPMADIAVLFASRGVRTTIITTPSTAHRFSKTIQKTTNYHHKTSLHVIQFKAVEVGLAPGVENQGVSNEKLSRFFKAVSMLQEPFEQFIQESQPNCIIADMFYPWTTEIAAKYNIPRIVFNGTGFFSLCVSDTLRINEPNVSSDHESFTVPHLPHEIILNKKQLPHFEGEYYKDFIKVLIEAMQAEVTSYGVIFNSFYELEPDYAYYYREVMKRQAWHIGPVSLFNKSFVDKVGRGTKSTIDEHECLKWLETKSPDSVVYLSFGTMVTVTSSQVHEIAMGLETCDQDFIWVIKEDQETSMPKGFEDRMKEKGKGFIIKGWAPQVLILDHDSVGVFLTHCGWNSVLEGVSGGVVMVTWPVMAEQFYNAKLVTDVLKIGVSIGDVEWSSTSCCNGVKREVIEKALARVVGSEGEEMRNRARVLKEKSKDAMKEGGSSYSDLTACINNIKSFKSSSMR
ncbi:scopoletin glucosyltransferase-like [Rutidosis leptorrhynchoides]|uniref:scopoletin glucosyltransferase-like n=1 Tax=Rutidosis leptorrhynchoides TaxID=125765 RepID=UPI003A98E55A